MGALLKTNRQPDATIDAARSTSVLPRSLFSPLLISLCLAGLAMGMPSSVQAQCPPAQIRSTIRQGLSDAEIDRRCRAADTPLPAWLAGTWEVTMHEEQTTAPTPMLLDPTVDHWQITAQGTELHIQRIRNAHLPEQYHRLESLSVREVKRADDILSFTVVDPTGSIPSTAAFQIDLQSPDALQGRYVQTSAGIMGLPSHRSMGAVTLRRVTLSLRSGAPSSLRYLPTNPLPRDWASTFCMPNCD